MLKNGKESIEKEKYVFVCSKVGFQKLAVGHYLCMF